MSELDKAWFVSEAKSAARAFLVTFLAALTAGGALNLSTAEAAGLAGLAAAARVIYAAVVTVVVKPLAAKAHS